VQPLLRPPLEAVAAVSSGEDELWKREKAVAMLAITEADFDRATGKLSDDDYRTLRGDYENRALHAMDEIEKMEIPALPSDGGSDRPRFCGACGTRFGDADRFCAGCGVRRDES
jgi:hypothetical protein